MINVNLMRSIAPGIWRQTGLCCICRRSFIIWIVVYMIIGLSIALFSSSPAMAQDKDSSDGTESEEVDASKSPQLNYSRISFRPSNLRDPFLNPLLKKNGEDRDQEIDRGLPPPGIAGTFISEAVLKGISIHENGRRLAIIQGSGKQAYFLREGDRLFDGYLKAIHRDSITLVRETKMRSGKVMTQNVTKQLRTP